MRTLIIHRSQPEDKHRQLALAVTEGDQVTEVHLYAEDKVDYDALLAAVFASDKVHCWW